MKTPKEMGQELKARREALGLSQEEVTTEFGFHCSNTVDMIESGTISSFVGYKLKYAAALDRLEAVAAAKTPLTRYRTGKILRERREALNLSIEGMAADHRCEISATSIWRIEKALPTVAEGLKRHYEELLGQLEASARQQARDAERFEKEYVQPQPVITDPPAEMVAKTRDSAMDSQTRAEIEDLLRRVSVDKLRSMKTVVEKMLAERGRP